MSPVVEHPPIQHEDLLARCLGNSDLADRILQSFAERFPGDLAQLEALPCTDLEEITRLAHRLKGVAGNIGATSLEQTLVQLEQAAAEGEQDQLPLLIAASRTAWMRCAQWIESKS